MRRISRIAFRIFAWVFLVGVALQVFLAGLVVVARVSDWENHVGLGHALGFPLLLMLVSMYLGRLSRTTKRLTWLLFAVYVLQADVLIFMRDSVPYAAALHPVLALIDFALGWRLARAPIDAAEPAPSAAAAAQPNL
jgi:hypothetical protein